MPPPFKEWWKGHIGLPVCPSPSASGVSNLRLTFSGGICVLGHISSFVNFSYFSTKTYMVGIHI